MTRAFVQDQNAMAHTVFILLISDHFVQVAAALGSPTAVLACVI